MLELFCLRDVLAMEHVTPGSSIVGHAAVTEAVTIAAIDVEDPGLDTVERFSSQGPVLLSFPQSETRAKPDVAGFDGISTAVPGFAPFFGTSAAAPHVAAIAALMLERNPFLTPAVIRSTLAQTAIDIAAPGFDPVAGAGRVDALAAVRATTPPECAADTDCADADLLHDRTLHARPVRNDARGLRRWQSVQRHRGMRSRDGGLPHGHGGPGRHAVSGQ